MLQPLVSVVIPVYNVENYLDRCLESVVAQTYSNLDIILVDDGSLDKSSDICDVWSLKDERISVIHKQNAGLGMARNSGIDKARGEYICFFDSDDTVDITTIEKCVTSVTENNSQVAVFGFCEVKNGLEVYKKINCKTNVYSGDDVLSVFLAGLFTYDMGLGISACMKMFDLNVIKTNNLKFRSEREIISEDAYFMLEFFSKVDTVSVVPQNLYFYYKNGGSLTSTYKDDRLEKNNCFLKTCLKFIYENNMPKIVADKVTVRYHYYIVAALKQIVGSEFCFSEKRKKMNSVFKDNFLRSTLENNVLKFENRNLKIFWYLVKFKMYFAAYLLTCFADNKN